jgi:hypothetical protein
MNGCKNYLSQLFNILRVSALRQIDTNKVEPLAHDPSSFEGEIAISKLKRYTMPGSDQSLAVLNQARGETLWS